MTECSGEKNGKYGRDSDCAEKTTLEKRDSELFMDRELVRLSSSASLFPLIFLWDKSVAAVMKWQAEYSEVFNSIYGVPSEWTSVARLARDLGLCRCIRSAAKSSCRRYFSDMKLMGPFPKPLRLFKKLHDDAAGEDSSTRRGALGVNYLDNAAESSANEHVILLSIEAAAAQTRG